MHILVFVLTFVLTMTACTRTPQPKGDILRIPLKDNVKTSDPTNNYDIVSMEVSGQIHEGLYQYNREKKQGDYTGPDAVIPALADGMPEVSKDRLTYTIKLKKGLRFQDDPCFKATNGKGREVVASDFLYAWKRHANPKNESQAFWIWDGKIAGINQLAEHFTSEDAEIEGFKSLDDHTIRIKLVRPYPQLLYVLTMHFVAPVPREAVEHYGRDFVNHPIGTGPYMAASWQPTSRIFLTRNPNFREEYFRGRRLPLNDGIEFTVLKEEQPRWLGFVRGHFDQIRIPKDNFASAIEKGTEVKADLKAQGIFVSVEPAVSYYYVSINQKDPFLGQHRLVRQAIASAVDTKTWLHTFKNGRGSVQTEINPPMVADRCGKPYRWTFDLERARQLLAQAGFAGGKGLPRLKWDTRGTDASERQIAEMNARNLRAAGFEVDVEVNTYPAYLEKQNRGGLQISVSTFSMDYADAENNLQLLYGPNHSPGPNEAQFNNVEYDRLYKQVAQMASGPARRALICRMEEIVQNEVPWAYGIYEDEYRIAQGRLVNFRTNEMILNSWKYVGIRHDNAPGETPRLSGVQK